MTNPKIVFFLNFQSAHENYRMVSKTVYFLSSLLLGDFKEK